MSFKKSLDEFRKRNQETFNTPEFKINKYESQIRSIYMVMLIFLFVLPAYVLQRLLGLENDELLLIIGTPLFVYSLFRARKKAIEKYEKENQ